jgi:hypothetical protein
MVKQLILCLAVFCSPAWATWTLTQVKDTTTCAQASATCAVTVTSTTAGHALIAGYLTGGNKVAISSVTAGSCAATWTHCPTCSASTIGADLFYCTNATSGTTSITITLASAPTGGAWIAVIWEAASSNGSIALDSGATPSNNKADTTCTACAGASLTLGGNNDFIAAIGACGGTCSALTGTGFTNDLSNPSGDGIGHGITSGSVVAPATWTQTSGTLGAIALALQEGTGGAACTPTLALMGVGRCG